MSSMSDLHDKVVQAIYNLEDEDGTFPAPDKVKVFLITDHHTSGLLVTQELENIHFWVDSDGDLVLLLGGSKDEYMPDVPNGLGKYITLNKGLL